jgi:hypothetical protein
MLVNVNRIDNRYAWLTISNFCQVDFNTGERNMLIVNFMSAVVPRVVPF